ncbi:hypothetical protein RI129_006009 [Pyrocoelia pectoralis]|uniref:Essential MCU regulator, mitochondrial n=1 Tax=Pyrocoelia pectoralis TaxID=417401 RepID=A0AAN7VEJ2_9COLE
MRLIRLVNNRLLFPQNQPQYYCYRNKIRTPSGGIISEPSRIPFGVLRVIFTVASGLLIGAAISKNIANFLEENDLFVPSDDDDDDD